MALNVEGSHFGIGDLNSFRVEALVDVACDGEAGIGGGGADQLDDDLVADQRFAAPVLGDVGKEAVLDTVPLAGTGRQVGDGYDEAGLVGKALEFAFPEADAGTVATAAVGRDGEALSLGIARIAEPLPPAADALDRKCGGIGIDSDVDPTLVGGNVVDAVGATLPDPLISKSWTRTGSGSPLRRSSRPPFLKSPTNSFFLVSTEIAGSPATIAAFTVVLMCSNCVFRSG